MVIVGSIIANLIAILVIALILGSAAGIKNALQYLHEQQLKVEVIGYVS